MTVTRWSSQQHGKNTEPRAVECANRSMESAFPEEIIIRIAEELDRYTLFRLRCVSKSFLVAARWRFRSEIFLKELYGKGQTQMLLTRLLNDPARAAQVRSLWAIPVNYSKDEMNLLITVLPLLHKLSRLAVSADSKPNLLEPLHFHKPFERLTDLRVNTTYTSFPHTFFESNICPALEHLYVSAICYVEEIHEMDVVERAIISFVNRHKNRMRTLGVTYANNLDMDVSAFVGGFGKLKMIETFMINGKWDLRTDSRPSPLQILLEKEPIYLREIDIAGTTDRPPERGVHPALLNTVPIHLPYLSILKLGILFEVSASSITWIRSILPQLHTLWLSCATLEADTLQKLFNLDHSDLDGAESTKAEPTYEKLRNLLLRMTYPTTFTIDALAKRFPSVRMLKLVMRELRTQSLQSGGSETARRVTSLALVLPHGRQWPYFEELVRENWPLHNFTAIVNMSDSETMIRKPFNGHLVKIKQSDCGCTDCRGVDSMPVGYC